jgi:hypothetical protein
MHNPQFSVLIGAALLVVGAFMPLAASGLVPTKLAEGTLAAFVAPILVLAVLAVVASCMRRSKAESVALGLVAAALPLLAKNLAEGKIASMSYVPNATFHFTAGAYLVWLGAAVLVLSALFIKTESA